MSNPDCKAGCGFICNCGVPDVRYEWINAHTVDETTGAVILPCPFCGAKASVEEIPINSSDPDVVKFSVGCDSDSEAECMGYQSLTTYDRRKDAIAAWNKRTKP